MVRRGWMDFSTENIQQQITFCGDELQRWGKSVKLRFKKEINTCRNQLQHLKRSRSYNTDSIISDVKQRLASLLAQEEIFWKQRSKLFWLKEGDANAKLFHHYASSRKQKNTIKMLQDDSGRNFSWDNGLHEHILNYFQNLFTSSGSSDITITNLVHRCIDDSQNQFLNSPFEEHEIVSSSEFNAS